MIKLKVKECPNPDYIGSYTFDKNLVYIGGNIDADLLLDDSDVGSNHLFIEIVNNQLLAHLNKDQDFFLVNGKRTTKFKFLNVGQDIKIGSSVVAVEIFAPTDIVAKREVLNKNTEELIQENSPLLEFIKELQKELQKES
ncbi:MAG: FHA domain-containing protein [Bacteriovoracaceae bacterium]